MSVPKYHELYAPFLKTLKDGSIHTMKEIKQSVVDQDASDGCGFSRAATERETGRL